MCKRPWLALAALTGVLGVFVPMEAPAQQQKPAAKDLLGRITDRSKVRRADVEKVWAAVGPELAEELKRGNTVTVPGLGTFRVVRVAEHKDIEAGTGRVLRVPAKNTVEFLGGEGLVEAANSATAAPVETVPAWEFNPLPNQTKGQKVGPTRTEGTRTR